MSDQAAPPAAAPAQAPPAAGAPDPGNVAKVHDCAVRAEKYVEQLATELGQLPGIDPAAIKAVSQMADVLRRISHGLGQAGIKAQPKPSIGDATDQMMAEHAAARQPPPQ